MKILYLKVFLVRNFRNLKKKGISIFNEKYYYLFLNTNKDYSSNFVLVKENNENTFIQKDIDEFFSK